ncbi:MAG: 16S rRNA (adenine(1518)-N(6)/adenine(1519)-N(6))-dimethyltransferase RsmA [Patescibacteria group bacterium]
MHDLYNLDYLHHLFSKYGLRPSRQYGQNYLIDEEVINKILELANISKDDTVVEVGPGFGVLTFPLAEKAGRVISYEIEKKLQPYWNEKIAQHKNIEVVWGNVLREFAKPLSNSLLCGGERVATLASTEERAGRGLAGRYKVIANLPYQITSAVIRLFLETDNPPESMVLMVQKEVGERICAEPGDMSLLSVSVQYYAEPKFEFIVPRTCFWPAPRVDSAVITIKPKTSPNLSSVEERKLYPRLHRGEGEGEVSFFDLVKAGFANRRKLLSKNLEPLVGKKNKEQLKKTFEELGLLPTVRAQELSVEEWKTLFSKL